MINSYSAWCCDPETVYKRGTVSHCIFQSCTSGCAFVQIKGTIWEGIMKPLRAVYKTFLIIAALLLNSLTLLGLKWIVFHTGIAGVGGRVQGAANFMIQVGGKNRYSAVNRFFVIE